MKLSPFFTYFGGKWRAAPHYPKPRHDIVVEAFAGSAGYALRHADRQVILCEANKTIAEIWRWLILTPEETLVGLPDVFAGEKLTDERFSSLDPNARAFMGMWMNKGMTGPCKTPSSWLIQKIRPNSSWGPQLREKLGRQLAGIRHWKVLSDYRLGVQKVATYFVDPPYQGRLGLRYPSHEIDYQELAAWCRNLQGQVIVCENEGATWLPFKPFRVIKGTEGRGRTGKSLEALWTNDPIPSSALQRQADGQESVHAPELKVSLDGGCAAASAHGG